MLFEDAKKLEKALGEESAKVIVEIFERFEEKQRLKSNAKETEVKLESEIKTLELAMDKMELRLKRDLTINFGIMLFVFVSFLSLILTCMLKP